MLQDKLLRATVKVIFDAQAYLYAEIQRLITESYGATITDEQFQEHMDEFKLETAELINGLLEEE